jgi:hypothetical protein
MIDRWEVEPRSVHILGAWGDRSTHTLEPARMGGCGSYSIGGGYCGCFGQHGHWSDGCHLGPGWP